MVHRVKLGTTNAAGSVATDQQGYSLRDVHGESPGPPNADPKSNVDKYLNYVLVALILMILVFGAVTFLSGNPSRGRSIVRQIEQENALAGSQTDTEKTEIMRQAQRVDRAEALGDMTQAKRELERLLLLDNGNAESPIHKLCIERLRSYK